VNLLAAIGSKQSRFDRDYGLKAIPASFALGVIEETEALERGQHSRRIAPAWIEGRTLGASAICAFDCWGLARIDRFDKFYNNSNILSMNLAEGVRFELTVGLHPRRFSRPLP
jgi:hypothetical protein